MGLFGSSRSSSSSTTDQDIGEAVNTTEAELERGATLLSGGQVSPKDGVDISGSNLGQGSNISEGSTLEVNVVDQVVDFGAVEAGKQTSEKALEFALESIQSQENNLEELLDFNSDLAKDSLDLAIRSQDKSFEAVTDSQQEAFDAISSSQSSAAQTVNNVVDTLSSGFNSAIGQLKTLVQSPDERAFNTNTQTLALLALGIGAFFLLKE